MLFKNLVDQQLINQARSCVDYVACKEQTASTLGVIPLSTLIIYQGPKTDHAQLSDVLSLHRAVRNSNCPSYMGIWMPVTFNLILT